MPKYFTDFPRINYTLPIEGKSRVITNILHRFNPLDEVLERVTLFYEYTVRDYETAEMVAHKFYDNMEYHWIIQMFNKKLDPYFDWPMSTDIFEKYIENKYGSEQAAKQTVKFYYHITSPKKIEVNGDIAPEKKNIINQEIYETLDAPERALEYVYDWEDRLNEQRRFIKIIDGLYIPQILKEKESIFAG